jgi:mRNA-degrading endonuclease RelE of RelBE toxin-antitoxin system
MKVIYTKHAEEKLKRTDIKKFGIRKKTIKEVLNYPESTTKTKYGDYATVSQLDSGHDLRVIYGIIDAGFKVITFHIARKDRYK